MSLKPFLLSFGIATVFALPAIAQDTEAFERDLDEAIKSACHGFMVDALPDAVSWLRTEIYENSPFCQRIQNAGDLEGFGEVVQDTLARLSADDVRLDLSQKQDRDLNVTIECDSEYMCMEIRLAFQETETPVAQSDYDAVQAYCDGRYGCIQAYFADWPAPLPVPTPIADAEMIRFDEILTSPVPGGSSTASDATGMATAARDGSAGQPRAETADDQATASDAQADEPAQTQQATQTDTTPATQVQAQSSQSAQASAAPAMESDLVFGPLITWHGARIYCRERGMRIPTLDEAQAQLSVIETGLTWSNVGPDSSWAVWTETQSSRNSKQVLLKGGNTADAFHLDPLYVVCFP